MAARTRTRSTAAAVPQPRIPAPIAIDHASVVVDDSGAVVLQAGTNTGLWTHLTLPAPLARALGIQIERVTRPAAPRART